MAVSSFAVRIGVSVPVVLNNLLHLDSLLGKIVTRAGGTVEDVPLATTRGVAHGSAAILETGNYGAVQESWPRLKAIKRNDVPTGLTVGTKPSERTIDAMSPYRNKLTYHTMYSSVRAVWFAGQGDAAVVADLLSDLSTVGGLWTVGHGETTKVEVFALDGVADAGMILADGLVARAVPADVWADLGHPTHPRAVTSKQRWKGPYWDGPKDVCISPAQADLIGPRRDVMAMVGLMH